MSQFPAGVLGLNGKGNYYEVERQAERLFSMPADRFVEIAENKHLTPNSVWMPPARARALLQLRSVLSADNQKTWDLAARTPYQHGYLVNLLFRARTAELVDDLAAVLKKFDARNPHATVNELMGVMMYRGHSFAGIEWGDRFQPQLTEAAAKITTSESDLEALHDAWAWTNHFYQSPAEYGVTFTLRDCAGTEETRLRSRHRHDRGHLSQCGPDRTGTCAVVLRNGRAFRGSVHGHRTTPQTKLLLADGLTPPHRARNLARLLLSWPRLAARTGRQQAALRDGVVCARHRQLCVGSRIYRSRSKRGLADDDVNPVLHAIQHRIDAEGVRRAVSGMNAVYRGDSHDRHHGF